MNQRLLALAALLLAACSKHGTPAQASFSYIDVPGGVRIETAGVRIEVADSVRYVYRSVSSSPGESSSSATLNGHPFGLRDGVFYIGEQDYGSARASALVRVSDEGVFVDGERRGSVPAPVEPKGG